MNYLKKGVVLSSILVLAACSSKIKNETVSEVAEVNEEEQLTFEMPRMSGQEYKAIDEDLSSKGIAVMNNETGEANFVVYCFGELSEVEDCMRHFTDMKKDQKLSVGSITMDGVEKHYAYLIKN